MNDADVAAIINRPKVCPNCDSVLVRPAKVNAYAWGRKVYCDNRCYRQALRSGRHRAYHYKTEGEYRGP